MQILANVVNFVLGLGGAIFLPFMIAILGMFFKMSFFDSFKNGLRIGAGLIGIDLVIGTLVGALAPASTWSSVLWLVPWLRLLHTIPTSEPVLSLPISAGKVFRQLPGQHHSPSPSFLLE